MIARARRRIAGVDADVPLPNAPRMEYIKREQLRHAMARAAGAWTATEYPEFDTAEKVVAWVRERRAEETDADTGSPRTKPDA